jgi:NDP-sugar pyrophosphorylase family protein
VGDYLMPDLTVILPCAGEGTRLSLPFPKEVFSIEKHKSLIDYSFDLFSNYGRRDVQFIITLNENKTEIVKYLSRYKHRFNISFTYFNPTETEYTGSIKSAKHLFGEKNLVLLPDTFLKMKTSEDILDLVDNSLNETGFTFFFKREKSPDMLRTKGALVISEDNQVIDYEDKPQENLERFNAFWCAFSFRKRVFDSCIEFMEKSTLNHRLLVDEIKNTPIYNSKAIEVDEYIDLGTWEQIYKFVSNKNG